MRVRRLVSLPISRKAHPRRPMTGLVCVALLLSACDSIPADPEGTLERVQRAPLRVGVLHAPPFADIRGDAPDGAEVELVERLAARLGTSIEWRIASPHDLMAALQRFEVDLVIGGVPESSPWGEHVGLSRPWREHPQPYVWALPPGENRWLVEVGRFLRRNRSTADGGSGT